MKIKKLIKIWNNDSCYSFVARSATNVAKDATIEELIIDHTPSTVGYSDSKKSIIKLIKPRSWHENIKLIWGHSRIDKELRGFRVLQELNIQTPQVFYYGFRPLLALKQKFIGFHVTENLCLNDHIECYELFSDKTTSRERRLNIIMNICEQLSTLERNNIVFTDFHLSNVFVDANNRITLIDPGLSKYHFKKKLNKKLTKSIKRLLIHHGSEFFTTEEKEYIMKKFKINQYTG